MLFSIIYKHYFCLLIILITKSQNSKQQLQQKQTPPQCLFEYNSTYISQGEIYSPNYPGLYPNNLNCRYEFNGRDNELIILQVDDFQLESPQSTSVQEINFLDLIETITRSSNTNNNNTRSTKTTTSTTTTTTTDNLDNQSPTENTLFPIKQCFYDFLDIFTIDKQGRSDWRSRHCGTGIDTRIVSTSPNLVLVFQTDRMLNYRGFKFRFHFSNLNIFPLITQTAICGPSQINGVLAGGGGQLKSPAYPQTYPANAECAWVITVASHQTVLIKFDELNLSLRCKQSFVRIYDGYVNDINKPDLSVCEKLKYYHKGIQTFYSKTNRVVINFVANKALTTTSNNNKAETATLSSSYLQQQQQSIPEASNNDNNNKLEKIGFQLTWTAVHLEDQCDGFKCKGGEYCIDEKGFLCQKTFSYCIAKELTCDGSFNCDIGDKSDETFCQFKLLRLDILFGSLAVFITFLFFMFIFIFYINTKLKRRNYMHRLRYRRPSQDGVGGGEGPDNAADDGADFSRMSTNKMPIPEFIDYKVTIATENNNNTNVGETTLKNDQIIVATSAGRVFKKTRNSIDLNKNEPIKINNNNNRHKRQKEQWYLNNNGRDGATASSTSNSTRLMHQNSIPTNSSSLNSISKSADDDDNDVDDDDDESISSPDLLDNTDNSNTDIKKKVKKSAKNNTNNNRKTLPVKLRSKSSHSNTNSLRRNSYTKVCVY